MVERIMSFINLQVFWYLPVILIFMGLLFWRARVRRNNLMRLILGPRAGDGEHVKLSLTRRFFRFVLLLGVMLMLIAAIARPTWKLQPVPYQTRGRDLMVLFDVSKSMLAQDVKPSRLAHAKLFLRDLVNQAGSDRFGLAAFAGDAFLECPLTTDKTSFSQYIDELDTQSIPLGGTNLQLALATALRAFDAAEGNNRAIILITDGDELTGNSRLALAELKKTKIPLLVVGVGDAAAAALIPVPQAEGQGVKFMRDRKGELVKTKLNVALMQQLAAGTGGCFVHSTTTNFGLDQIEDGIKKLLPEDLEKGEKTRPVERFYYFLTFATFLLWLWMLISEHPGRKHRSPVKLAAAFMVSALFAVPGAEAQEPQPGKLPESALKNVQEAPEPEPELKDPVEAYNQAREIQLQKEKGDSARLYETAINLAAENPTVRINSFNNLGVGQHRKARQEVMQAVEQVKQQNLDGAISQLEGSKKILDTAEEMYVKALSTKGPELQDKDKKAEKPSAINETAVNQQLLLNDRAMIDELIKKIKELKKQQEKARKQTQKAQQQQKQQQNKQEQQPQQNQQKQQQKDQQQNKQNQQQQKDQQQKQQKQQKDQQQKQQQDQPQQKDQQQQNKQEQQQPQNKPQPQQQKPDDELKKAQNEVKKLEKQANELGQKKLEEQAGKAEDELDKAEKARARDEDKKAEEHIKKALEQLQGQTQNKQDKQPDKKDKGQGKKDKQDKQKDRKKDKGGQDKKDQEQPKPQPQAAQAAQAGEAPKDIDPKEARQLLEIMAGKEKDLREALKAYRQQQYKNKEVEKDW